MGGAIRVPFVFYTNHRISLTGKSGVRSDSCLSHSGHEAWLQRHDLRNHGPATCRFAAAWRCFEQRKFQLRISFALFKTRNEPCWPLPILCPVMSCGRRTVTSFSSPAVAGPSQSGQQETTALRCLESLFERRGTTRTWRERGSSPPAARRGRPATRAAGRRRRGGPCGRS